MSRLAAIEALVAGDFMINGSQIMVKCLEAENVKVIFGYPGAAICPFYDALYDSPIKHILVRQEQNAGHAASGYARASSTIGVCVATSGPGATNLITGLATAYMDSIPLVAITGQVRSDLLGKDVFQEVDITGACEPFTKNSYLVRKTEDLPRIFREAFHIAGTGRPGPVLIDVPMDIQQNEISEAVYPQKVSIAGYKPQINGHALQIKRAAKQIEQAERPLIVAGGGVLSSGAKPKLIDLVDKTGIPVITTMMGIGVMPSEHPSYLGMLGSHGKKSANTALNKADVIITCGARVGDRAFSAPNEIAAQAKIIHIDIDPAEIGKNMPVHIPIVGHMKNVLTHLSESINYKIPKDWQDTVKELRKQSQEINIKGCENGNFVEPKSFISEFSALLPDKAILCADVGQNQICCANNFNIKRGRFLTTGGMGTMGYSIPAAIGAKLARPGREVFTVCGDGSFQMSMCELATAVQNNIPVKIIIMRNNKLGMVCEIQNKLYKGRLSGTLLDSNMDFSKIAEAYSITYFEANSNEQALKFAKQMLKSKDSGILVCNVQLIKSN